MSRTVILVCAALMVASAAPVWAQTAEFPGRSERVEIGDLDLYDPKGAEELLNRVNDAAYAVCHREDRPLVGSERHDAEDCAAQTTENTVNRLDHPMVTAIHNGQAPYVVIEEGSADPYREYPAYIDVQKK